jgi:hypothetical protein
MKTGALLAAASLSLSCLSSLSLLACGATQTAEQTRTTSAAITVEAPSQKAAPSEAEKWAEQKVKEEALAQKAKGSGSGFAQKGGDPLAMNDALEDSAIPKIEMTPAREVRGKSRGDLDAAMKMMESESSVDGAAKTLTMRLGKPSWTENGTKRVWVATGGGAQCHRLVLEPDGTAEVETASKTEWRMVAATARMNPCTGEIKRGIEGK